MAKSTVFVCDVCGASVSEVEITSVTIHTGRVWRRTGSRREGVTDTKGLYFLGLPWQHTRGSALLGWVKDDAAYIAEQIAAVA